MPYLLRQLMPQLTHAHGGLVFLRSDAPYGGPNAAAEWSPPSPPCAAPPIPRLLVWHSHPSPAFVLVQALAHPAAPPWAQPVVVKLQRVLIHA